MCALSQSETYENMNPLISYLKKCFLLWSNPIFASSIFKLKSFNIQIDYYHEPDIWNDTVVSKKWIFTEIHLFIFKQFS